MRKKLLIILANSDPEEFSVPLFRAMVAAALSRQVEVIFIGRSAVLAVRDHAENVILNVQDHRTVYDVIRLACRAGVVFKAWSPALEMWGREQLAEIDKR
jgi:predicted peroxiredoxin